MKKATRKRIGIASIQYVGMDHHCFPITTCHPLSLPLYVLAASKVDSNSIARAPPRTLDLFETAAKKDVFDLDEDEVRWKCGSHGRIQSLLY